jgi:hypothetical protein
MDTLARPLIFANLAGIFGYIVLWTGAERFLFESFGTWVMSPVIYTRVCPELFRAPLIHALAHQPILGHLLCAIPVVMFFVAVAYGIVAYKRRSLLVALLACVLMSSIFVVYHSVKHMGMQVVYY